MQNEHTEEHKLEMTRARRERFTRELVSHERQLHSYVLSLVLDWKAAEEILQETYLRLLERLEEWDESKNVFPWACRFAYYQVLTYRNDGQRDRLRFSDSFIESVSAAYESKSDQLKLRLEALEHCMEQLDPGHQQLLGDFYSGDSTVEEIACKLERTVSSLYQSLSRLRRSLKKCVESAIRPMEDQ